jgi:L-threonylcarbamoyladenylate synthase
MKTEIIKTTNKNAIPRALKVLSSGGVVIYPTETCYGIGADATNDSAVEKVIRIKKRSREKKISIAVSDIRMAKQYLVVTKNAEKLAKAFMPGPLTLIVESKGKKKVGFRIPDNNLVRRLVKKFGKPITTTSANISNEPPFYRIKDMIKAFNGKADLILDGGNLKKTRPSTVYDISENKILRKGPVSEKQIRAVLS